MEYLAERAKMPAPTIQMKGSVVGVMVLGESVQVWVSSPTGDSSDSFQYIIPCQTQEQATVVAEMWRKTWSLI